jgi:hypothetical protein
MNKNTQTTSTTTSHAANHLALKTDELIRNSREFIEEAARDREKRGLPTAFLPGNSAALSLEFLAGEARRLGCIEGPGLLTPAQTAAAEKIRDGTDRLKSPEQWGWIERLLRQYGAGQPRG